MKTIFCFFPMGTGDKTSILVLLWDSIQARPWLSSIILHGSVMQNPLWKNRWTWSYSDSFKDKSLSKAPLDKGPCILKHTEQDTAVSDPGGKWGRNVQSRGHELEKHLTSVSFSFYQTINADIVFKEFATSSQCLTYFQVSKTYLRAGWTSN